MSISWYLDPTVDGGVVPEERVLSMTAPPARTLTGCVAPRSEREFVFASGPVGDGEVFRSGQWAVRVDLSGLTRRDSGLRLKRLGVARYGAAHTVREQHQMCAVPPDLGRSAALVEHVAAIEWAGAEATDRLAVVLHMDNPGSEPEDFGVDVGPSGSRLVQPTGDVRTPVAPPSLPLDPVPTTVRTVVGDQDPSGDVSAGLAAGKDYFLFRFKSYVWRIRVNLDAYPDHPTRRLILRGGGVTTVNSDPNTAPGFFEGGRGWEIFIDGIKFRGNGHDHPDAAETRPLCAFSDFTLFKAYASRWECGGDTGLFLGAPVGEGRVGIYHCHFDKNARHGLDMDRVGDFAMVKPIVQRNGDYGLRITNNRTSGTIRGAHLEGHDRGPDHDWGIHASGAFNLGVYEAYTSGGSRIWVDDPSCEVRNCGVLAAYEYEDFEVQSGTTAHDRSMICGGAVKSGNYDVARLPGSPPPHV